MTLSLIYTCCGKEKIFTNRRTWCNAKKKLKDTGILTCQKCFGKRISEQYKGVKNPDYKRYNNEKKFFRKCGSCGKDMGFVTEKLMKESLRLKTICNTCSGIIYKKGKRLNDSLTQEKRLSMIATREGYPDYETYYATFEERKKFHRKVWNLTYKQPISLLENYDKRGKSGIKGAYQIDHIVSIKYAFENGIPAEEIADIKNLRMIPWEENIKKGSKFMW